MKSLMDHEAWADAEHWTALRATPSSLKNEGLVARLQHIHMVQRGFHGLLTGKSERPQPIPDVDALQTSMRDYHEAMQTLLASMPLERLAETIAVPWFGKAEFTILDAITQMAMHSQYHRGQNAVRLREEGGEPPLTDYIVWVHRGRPAPAWPPLASPTTAR